MGPDVLLSFIGCLIRPVKILNLLNKRKKDQKGPIDLLYLCKNAEWMKKTSPEIKELRNQVEEALGRKLKTPKDFSFLGSSIWNVNHEMISPTTLKRLWGYIDGAEQTRGSTLDILSRFIGYRDWDDFLGHVDRSGDSDPILSFHIGIEELVPGDRVYVSWKPDRRCTFRYLGNATFIVEESKNSKLQKGDTFSTTLFILNEPLYLSNLVQGDNPPVPFVIGNRDGLCELERGK